MTEGEDLLAAILLIYEFSLIYILIEYILRCRLQDGAHLERGVIYQRNIDQGPYAENDGGGRHQGKGIVFLHFRSPEFPERDKGPHKEQRKDDILDKRLQVSKMESLTKAAAIHLRVENQQDQSQQSKKSLE